MNCGSFRFAFFFFEAAALRWTFLRWTFFAGRINLHS